jgi:nucleotide-binding universal stress UspA family protein
MDIPGGAVVVGVTGPGENTTALRYAVHEAQQHGRPLLLANAAHVAMPPPPPAMLMDPVPWEQVARAVVGDVAHELDELFPHLGVEVYQIARTGPAGVVLAELSEKASVVVLQHRSMSRLRRLFTGSTVIATAANSHCPVVSVPESWEDPGGAGRIVVGVHEDGTPGDVLEVAFTEAAQHGHDVHLVHAWRLDPAYDDLVGQSASGWDEGVRKAMAEAAAPYAGDYPTVNVEFEVRHQWSADGLLEAAEGASLLVVGRHGTRLRLPHRIGSVARTLLRSSPCPVVVVPV